MFNKLSKEGSAGFTVIELNINRRRTMFYMFMAFETLITILASHCKHYHMPEYKLSGICRGIFIWENVYYGGVLMITVGHNSLYGMMWLGYTVWSQRISL